jgi:hypothetical protein
MKIALISFLMLLGSLSFAQEQEQQPAPEPRAVVVDFFGGFTGFDQDAYKAVKASMAALLIEGTVDHYITTSWGFEGGTSFCVELTKDPSISTDRITKILSAIHPGNNTVYKFDTAVSCTKN